LLLGAIVAAGALLWVVTDRREEARGGTLHGNFALCSSQTGEAARACYARETGRELATVSALSGAPDVVSTTPLTGEVTFASTSVALEAEPLLCDLHARVGVVDEQVPSWLGWTEPLAQAAPAS
jgi:hypothetical protein